MDDFSSPRKRKRPPYLEDFYDSLIEEVPVPKKQVHWIYFFKDVIRAKYAQVVESDERKQDCLLCGEMTELANKWDLMVTTGNSKHTLSDVLNTLFKEENMSSCSPNGFLCTVCKDFVGDLDRLQNEVVAVKHWIISAFKKTKQIKAKDKEVFEMVQDETKAKPSSKMKTNTTVVNKSKELEKETEKTKMKNKDKETTTKENVYNIEYLKEKKGSKFLVKWENYPEKDNTWEPRASIPSFILKVLCTTSSYSIVRDVAFLSVL